jgi:hypothetical protein
LIQNTKKEITVPTINGYGDYLEDDSLQEGPEVISRKLGVLDLDCLAPGGFDEDDKEGLERIANLIVDSCDW